jgi:hypothetical protein
LLPAYVHGDDAVSGDMKPIARYERQIPARLVVRLENGEEWDADEGDLLRFGFCRTVTAEYEAGNAITLAGLDPSGDHSGLRYAIERALRGAPLDPDDAEDAVVLATLRHQAELFRRGVNPDEWELPDAGGAS